VRRTLVPIGLALSLALLGVPAQAGGGTEDLLDTLTVFADDQNPVTSKFDLVSDREYKLVFTGTGAYTNAGVDFENDAIWCYKSTFPEGYCAPDSLNDPDYVVNCLEFRIGDEPFQQSTLPGRFDGGPAPTYNTSHRYEWTFVAHRSGALAYRDRCDTDDATGTYRIEIRGDQPSETTVSEPVPGGSVSVSSPDPLPRKGGEVTVNVTSSAGDLNGTTIVGEGEVSPEAKEKEKARKVGEAVAACWLLGPDALATTEEAMQKVLTDPEVKEKFRGLQADEQLRMCITFVTSLGQNLSVGGVGRTSAAAAQMACGAERIALEVRSRKGKIVGVKLAKKQRRPASAPRYGCSSSGGDAEITVTHGRKASLREGLGKKLDLAAVRAPDAVQRDATLTFGFS
jgi:hypothetical protein